MDNVNVRTSQKIGTAVMDQYCGSRFWDANITWNTYEPDFTECFEETALLWFACGFLWLTAIFDIYFRADLDRINGSLHFDQPTWLPGWTKLTVFKIFNITLLICLEIIVFCLNWFNNTPDDEDVNIFDVPDVLWVTPLVLIVTHFFSAVLIVFHKNRCVHTSGIQLIHWLLLSLTHGFILRTLLHHSDQNESVGSIVVLGICLFIMLLQSFLFCWSDIPDSKPEGHCRLIECSDGIKRAECPMIRASCLSYVLFSWCTSFVRKGYKEPLTKSDLWDLIPSVKASVVYRVFDKYYGQLKYGEVRSICRNIIKPLWQTCGWSFTLAVTCKLVSSLLAFLAPKVMGYMIDYVEDKSIEAWKGFMYAIALLLIFIVITLFLEQYYLHMFKCYINIMTCLNLKIYRKSMNVSYSSRKDTTTGEIVNLMSVDTEKIRTLIYEADVLWSTPLQVALGIYLLWNELGYAVLPGVGVLCLIIPINWALTAVSAKFQTSQMKKKDERIKVISEVLSGIQVIKLYAWEPSFARQIKKIRSDEIRILRKRMFVQCAIQFVFDSVPFLVSIASFFTYIYMTGGVLDPKKAFTAISLFTLLTDPITDFPTCISSAVDASVSFKRINKFLNAEEVDVNATRFERKVDDEEPAIEIIKGDFAWDDFAEEGWQLSEIDLEVKPGSLTAVVGRVGSGKSSLLSAILGHMKYTSPVVVRGRVAYVPQTAWILNGTLRENICFGKPYIKEKYDKVITACCLTADIAMLPASDMTEIGEKGINLSGGQKQRVNLARAAYSDADVFLLDDVLSAVDPHVGKFIFDNLLSNTNGYLSGKTRILCTHAYNFLSQMDQVIVMNEGRIVESGTYADLLQSKLTFSRLLLEQVQSDRGSASAGYLSQKFKSDDDDDDKKEAGKLIVEERLETGDVKLRVFMAYVKAMKFRLVFAFILFFGLSEALSLARNIILSKWTETNSVARNGRVHNSFASTYATLGIGQSLFYLIGFFVLAISSLRATKLLHNNMLHRILHAPMSFFNVTLLGRIVNRFSSDVESLDKTLPSNVGDWICHIFKFLGILVAISYTNFYFILFVIPLSLVYYVLQRHYILCMQQLQRIMNALKSPIYAQFQETLNGTSTVRAYRAQDRFAGILGDKIDNFNRALFPHLIVRRWLSIRLGVLGSFVVFIPAFFAVLWRDTMDPSLVGLSISYALQITSILSWLIKVTSYIQYNFVSVERVLEYSEIEQEAAFYNSDIHLDPAWPQRGGIEFHDYETRYRPGLELVLKHFTCYIQPGTKIGVVGRTGAGKSSFALALFRIIEAVKGEIVIDGINIADLGLHDLRRRLTVIPQDPLLFSRSLRLNLDPFEEYEDNRLWEALTLAHLRDFVADQPDGLDFPIAEGGENLSVGQRQLVCLTRAILRKSSILILDEATASVDSVTDELIQRTIRKHFASCTILNVAHRLKTVLDSTKILVLSKGEIIEYDTPEKLLNDPNSHFYGMARDAGIVP